MVDFEGKREAKSGWWVILHQIIFAPCPRWKILMQSWSLIYSASRRRVKSWKFLHRCLWPIKKKGQAADRYSTLGCEGHFTKKYFSLHIRAALPANETRRFFIDHRPLKEKKSCVDGVETRIGLTVERGAGNLETRSRIQDRRGLRIRSQWISKIADRNQWGLRMKSQWTSRIEDSNRRGLGIAVTLKSRIDEDWGLLVAHLDEVTSRGRQLTGRFISHHCIGLAFSPSTIMAQWEWIDRWRVETCFHKA